MCNRVGVPLRSKASSGRAFRGSAIAPLLRNSFAAPTIPHASKLAGKAGFSSRAKARQAVLSINLRGCPKSIGAALIILKDKRRTL